MSEPIIVAIPDEPFVQVRLRRTATVTYEYWENVPGSDEEAARRWVEDRLRPPNFDIEQGPMLTTDLRRAWGYRITSGNWSAPESAQLPESTPVPTPAQPRRQPRQRGRS